MQMFKRLHSAFCDTVCNPFYVPSEPLAKSRRFMSAANDMLVKTN